MLTAYIDNTYQMILIFVDHPSFGEFKGDIKVPVEELPDPEPDNGNPLETLREQEMKWNDFALNRLQAQPDASP